MMRKRIFGWKIATFCALLYFVWAAFSLRTSAQIVEGAPAPVGAVAPAPKAAPAARDVPLSATEHQRVAAELLANLSAPPYGWFASTDARHKNLDYVRIKPGESVRVPLSAGRLVRLWSTASMPRKLELQLENGQTTKLLGNGEAARGVYEEKTYLWYPRREESLADLTANSALVATNRGEKQIVWYYQATVRPLGDPQNGALPSVPDLTQGEKTGAVNGVIPASVTLPAFMVTKLRIEGLAPTLAELQSTRLQIVSQGETLVDVPLAPLVGAFERDPAPFHDAMTAWDGHTLELFWPMPFAGETSMRLHRVPNAPAPAPTLTASWVALPQNWPLRFRAATGSGQSVRGTPFSLLAVEGAGAFVGVRMAVAHDEKSTRYTFGYLEGNEKLVADGTTYEGTGTEDFYNSAWYFPSAPLHRPYGGLTEKTQKPTNSSMYRLMIGDAVPFGQRFEFLQEVGYNNTWDNLNYRWIVFWYQKPGGRARVADTLAR